MQAPFTMASSDGGLVPVGGGIRIRATTARSRDGSRVYVRERKVVGLEFAIRSMTSLPASVFGIDGPRRHPARARLPTS